MLCAQFGVAFKKVSLFNSDYQNDQALVSKFNNKIAVLTRDFNRDKIQLCVKENNRSKFDTSFVNIGEISFSEKDIIEDFCFTDSSLCILTEGKIYFFRLSNEKKWLINNNIENKKLYQYYKCKTINDSSILFYKCYNFHKDDSKEKVELAIYDVNKNKFVSVKNPKSDGIIYSCFVNNWITYSNNFIFFSNTLHYKIFIYDTKLNLIDSIIYLPNNWKHFDNYKINFETEFEKINPKECLKKARYEGSKIDRIEKILALNDSVLIVSVAPDFKNQRYREVYIWKFVDQKWVLSKKKIKFKNEPMFLTKKRFLFGLNYSSELFFIDDNAFFLELYCKTPFLFSLKPFYINQKFKTTQQLNFGLYQYKIIYK